MKRKSVHFQSIDFKFPKTVWMSALWLLPVDGSKLPMYLRAVKKDKKAAIKHAEELLVLIKKQNGPASALNSVILVPLTFSRLYPLKKEFWENPSEEKESYDRTISFCDAILHPELFYLLVTPDILALNAKKTELSAAFVFKKDEVGNLDAFIRASTQPVAPEAKNAAIYNIGFSFGYDLKKKEDFINEKNLVS